MGKPVLRTPVPGTGHELVSWKNHTEVLSCGLSDAHVRAWFRSRNAKDTAIFWSVLMVMVGVVSWVSIHIGPDAAPWVVLAWLVPVPMLVWDVVQLCRSRGIERAAFAEHEALLVIAGIDPQVVLPYGHELLGYAVEAMDRNACTTTEAQRVLCRSWQLHRTPKEAAAASNEYFRRSVKEQEAAMQEELAQTAKD